MLWQSISMQDATESARRGMVQEINSAVQSDSPEAERARLSLVHGANNVWDTGELTARFQVIGFAAPFCMVRERTSGAEGIVEFQHSPRFYFGFIKD